MCWSIQTPRFLKDLVDEFKELDPPVPGGRTMVLGNWYSLTIRSRPLEEGLHRPGFSLRRLVKIDRPALSGNAGKPHIRVHSGVTEIGHGGRVYEGFQLEKSPDWLSHESGFDTIVREN